MATNFPGSADSFTNPTGTDNLSDVIGGRTHAQMHADVNDAVEAVEAFLLAGSPVSTAAKTADYTATVADAGKVIEFDSATGVVLTVPPASSEAWQAGTVLGVYQAGAGNVSVAAGAGVTIRNNAALRGQYAEASLRYRGSDEWVLAGDLASASAPALKDYAEVLRTSGNISLTSTTMAAVSSSLDLTLAADVGDLIEFSISAFINVVTDAAQFDVYTMVSGSPVNPFTIGVGGTSIGAGGWDTLGSANFTTTDKIYHGYKSLTGGLTRVVTADDISGGTVTLRLYSRQGATTANTLFASNPALKVWAKNFGQV